MRSPGQWLFTAKTKVFQYFHRQHHLNSVYWLHISPEVFLRKLFMQPLIRDKKEKGKKMKINDNEN